MPETDTNAVALKLPPFWQNEPELWFTQIESRFNTRGIKADQTKYDYVICALDNDASREVKAQILHPPTEGKYDAIKLALTAAFGRSQAEKDAELLAMTDLGDRKPSSHLRYLQALNSDGKSLLRAVFLSHLPTDVRAIVQSQNIEDIDKLAQAADRAVEARDTRQPLNMAAVNKPHKQRNHTAPSEFVCRFHRKFGAKAFRCLPGCTHPAASARVHQTETTDEQEQGNDFAGCL